MTIQKELSKEVNKMTIAQLLGVEMSEWQILAEIKKAMAAGLPEVRLGSAIIKLPSKLFVWEYPKD